MEKPASPLVEHLKEYAWAVLMIDLIIGVCALVLARHIGIGPAARVFVGLATLVTVVIGGIVLLNVVLLQSYERWEKRASRRRPSGASGAAPGDLRPPGAPGR
ncbi:MAG: hypothetical protein JO040_02500 [Gemmatimonadetes bacterium]|nr:hypothetical protein [Gemmatimonadota bacterium]